MSGEEVAQELKREVLGESSGEETDTNSVTKEEDIQKGTSVDPEQIDTEETDMSDSTKEVNQKEGEVGEDVSENSRGNEETKSQGNMDVQVERSEGMEFEKKNVSASEESGEGHGEAEKKENGFDGAVSEHQSGASSKKKAKSSRKQAVIDNDEEVDVGDLTQLTEDSRNILFGRGLVYERAGKKNCALKCYLACLSHLTPQSNFVLLPQCLRNIADLYYRKELYEKAILFIQAEKLFYENALIDTSEVQQKIEALREGLENTEGIRSNEDAKIAADSLRADEYEHLAKLCVDKKQPQLALEYAGKATKLRQKIYGNDNPITKESLDFFATLYAEVGKQQYSDSMSQLSEPGDELGESSSPVVTSSMERSPSSILRQRKTGESETERKKQVRFQEPEGTETTDQDSHSENEEFISRTLLWILLFICSILLCILGVWLLCTLTDSLTCKWVGAELQHVYMKIKYYYYQYASTKKIKYM